MMMLLRLRLSRLVLTTKISLRNTYKDIDGKGVKYSVKIIIPSNDNSHGDIKREQIFYVKEECVPYVYNPALLQ